MSPQDRYRAFAAQHALPIWQQPWYLDAICWGGDWTAYFVEKQGQDVLAWPFFVKKKLGLSYVTMPLFCKQMGPVFAEGIRTDREQQALIQTALEQLPPWKRITQDLPPSVTNWLPWHWASYQQTTRYTYQLDITELAEVRSGLNRNMRRAIKKGSASFHLTDAGTLEEAYALQAKSFTRQGLRLPYTFEQLQQHDAALVEAKARKLFFAADAAGKLLASAHLIWDDQTAYYHLAGEDPAAREQQVGIWLTWQAIEWAAQELPVATSTLREVCSRESHLSVSNWEGVRSPIIGYGGGCGGNFGLQAEGHTQNRFPAHEVCCSIVIVCLCCVPSELPKQVALLYRDFIPAIKVYGTFSAVWG